MEGNRTYDITDWDGMEWDYMRDREASGFAARYIHCVIGEGGDMRYRIGSNKYILS